jgi:hypothetical protein
MIIHPPEDIGSLGCAGFVLRWAAFPQMPAAVKHATMSIIQCMSPEHLCTSMMQTGFLVRHRRNPIIPLSGKICRDCSKSRPDGSPERLLKQSLKNLPALRGSTKKDQAVWNKPIS